MPQTKNEIEEICSLVEIPRLFISNHFIDLKSEIDSSECVKIRRHIKAYNTNTQKVLNRDIME